MDNTLPTAWQPLTPRGVASFAGAPLKRLLIVEGIVAVLAAAVVVWCLQLNWYPVIGEAIRQMPADSRIRRGELVWRGDTPVRLASSRFLTVAVDQWHESDVGRDAHVVVEFGRREVRLVSVMGYVPVAYPTTWIISFSRADLEPWWGAWRPWISLGVGVVVWVGLMLSWALLATIYCLPAWLLGWYANRDLGFGGSWRLASATLMPGAVLLILAIFFYGLGWMDLIRLGFAAAFHFVMAWIYLFVSPSMLPRHPEVKARGNPFASPGG